MSQLDDIFCGVLAGGRSTRMGRDKATLPRPGGGTFLEHVVRVARSVAADIVLLGSPARVPESLRSLRALADAQPQRGPVAGLCSALAAAESRWVLLLSCDLPLLTPGTLERLLARRARDADAVAFTHDADPTLFHACCALYHPRLLPAARGELLGEHASLQGVLRGARVAALAPDAAERRSLLNVNSPEELAALAAGMTPAVAERTSVAATSAAPDVAESVHD